MSLPRPGSLQHLSLVRLCKANAPRSGMIWKDCYSEKSKSSWIILDCFFPMNDGFHHHVSLFCSFVLHCFAMFTWRAQHQNPESRDRRDLEPYPALTGTVWASLESENHTVSWMSCLMFSQARFANSFAPLCSFCSNSLGMFVFTFVLLMAVFCSWRCQISQAACRVN